MSKGDITRPASITQDEYAKRHQQTFCKHEYVDRSSLGKFDAVGQQECTKCEHVRRNTPLEDWLS